MRVTKWGDSLAVRIPADVAETLRIMKEGDEVDVVDMTEAVANTPTDEERRQALEKIRALRWPLPPDYKFDRDEAKER